MNTLPVWELQRCRRTPREWAHGHRDEGFVQRHQAAELLVFSPAELADAGATGSNNV